MPSCAHARVGKGPRSRDLAEPVGTRLGATRESLTIDGDHAKRRAVSQGPLEVVEQAPVEIAPYLDTRRETGQHLSHRGVDIPDPFLVERGRDPALRYADRRPARTPPGPPARSSEGLRVPLLP